MVSLTDEQVDFIRKEIESHGISLPDLQANLIDHMCTIIENEMSDNDDFHLFFYSILPRFFHDNLHEIEMETIQLIHQQKFKHMKKSLNYVLAFSSILLVTGSIFKIFHLAGAAMLIVSSLALVLFAAVPLALIGMHNHPISKTQKSLSALISLIVLLFACGGVFKVQHWPFANILMLSSVGLLCLVYVPVYFVQQRKTSSDTWTVGINSFLFLLTGITIFLLFDLRAPLFK
jgi:hypothetical protein